MSEFVQLSYNARRQLNGPASTGEALTAAHHINHKNCSSDNPITHVNSHERSQTLVHNTDEKPVSVGIEAALTHTRPKRKRPRVQDSEGEAHLVQLACSAAPDGRERWTLQMLADKLVELEVVERISPETVRTTLKKTNLSLG